MEEMATARGLISLNLDSARDLRKLTSGPGRLCEALEISRLRDNGKDMVSPESDLQVLDDGFHPAKVLVTRRIGISKSAAMPLRYVIAGNEFVSGKTAI
jgi:DNA-3-methyladenine glycosylase